MRKSYLIGFLVILSLFLFGCNAAEEAVPSDAAVAEIFIDDFSVPQGYTLVEKTASELSIVKDGQVIGGILATDIITECDHNSECQHIEQYLRDLDCEYINMYGDNMCHISCRFTDRDTGEQQEQSRHIFLIDDTYYDLWLDKAYLTEDEIESIVSAVTK